jgi:hypothetical protein
VRKRFDENLFGQTGTDAKPGVADLANEIGVAAEKLDFLLLAKAHFPQSMSHFRGCGELLDPYGDAGIDAA